MAIAPKPGDFYRHNTRERVTSDDLTSLAMLPKLDIGMVMARMANNSKSGFVLRGFKCVQDSPTGMNVRVASGIYGIFDDLDSGLVGSSDFVDIWHAFKLGFSDATQEVTIAANSSGNPRIDLIQLTLIPDDDELITADIYNNSTESFDSVTNTPKVKRYKATAANLAITVKQGTPGASPEEPEPDGNPVCITLAAVYVANGATSITDSVIYDRRDPFIPASIKGFFNDDGTIMEATFYGSSKELVTSRGGMGGSETPSIELQSKVSTGVYRYNVTGFKSMKFALGGATNVEVGITGHGNVISGGASGGFVVVSPAYGSGYNVSVSVYDVTGTLADLPFSLELNQMEF